MSPASARDRAIEIAERVGALGPVTVTRFFSGAGLVADGVQFAFFMKGSLHLRVDDLSRAAFEALGASPFAYASRSKTVTVANYYEAPGEVMDDSDELARWVAQAHRTALAASRNGRMPRSRPLTAKEFVS